MDNMPEKLELKPERVQQMLADLPRWALGPDGRGIERVRKHTSTRRATEFAALVCRLASTQRQRGEGRRMKDEGRREGRPTGSTVLLLPSSFYLLP